MEVTKMQNPIFHEFPVFAYEIIFRLQNLDDLLNCRLVCSEWYKNIMKIFNHPNCFSIGDINSVRKFGFCQKYALDKYFMMKCYEDPGSPVQVLNIQDLSILKWRECFQESKDFQETAKHITELKLRNIIFPTCNTAIEFLNNFEKLANLAVQNCGFDCFRKEDANKSAMGILYTASLSDILSNPKCLNIEMKENSWEMALIIEMLDLKLKLQTLEGLKLTILPPGKETLSRKFVSASHDLGSNRSMAIVYFLKSIITKHEQKLKSLSITWESLQCDVTPCDSSRYALLVPKHLSDFLGILQMLSVSDNELSLTNFKINLGRIAFHPFMNFWHLRSLKTSLIPFLTVQIERGLREIDLGQLVSVGFPIPLITLVRDLRYGLDILGYPHDDSGNVLRIKYAHELITTGTKDTLEEFHRVFDRNTILPYMSFLLMEKFKVSIKNSSTKPPANVVENFREYLWNYDLPLESNFKVRYHDYDFLDLTELVVDCDMKHFQSYNISTICFLCPNLSKLKIADGPEFQYKKEKHVRQYQKMSQATINDYDMRFIFSSLVHLKELVIWANLSAVSNRGFIDVGHLAKENRERELSFDDHTSYHEFAHMVNLYYTDSTKTMPKSHHKSTDLYINNNNISEAEEILDHKRKALSSDSIASLKDLTYLSLRGVGEKISDEILYSENGLCSLKKLKYLEILGNHKISGKGKKLLGNWEKVRLN